MSRLPMYSLQKNHTAHRCARRAAQQKKHLHFCKCQAAIPEGLPFFLKEKSWNPKIPALWS